MGRLFDQVRAPSTLGTFLRSFTFGHVRQLDAVLSQFTAALTAATPVLPGLDQLCFVDVDDTAKATYGHAKQGVGFGHAKVDGLNALLATVSVPAAAPLIAGTRLRGGTANSARGAGRFVTEAVNTTRRAGATGQVLVRADSGFYTHAVISACQHSGAWFSVTARLNPAVRAAIEAIEESAWVPIKYPTAVYGRARNSGGSPTRRWPRPPTPRSPAPGTARPSRSTARLIVRRVRRLNPANPAGQDELFALWRYHPVFTDSDLPTLAGRGHPPRPRHHRADHRRPQSRSTRAPALREVRRQRRLAGPDRDHSQPAPRHRHPRRRSSHQSPTRHPAHPTGQRPGPDLPLRTTPHHPPTHQLAMAGTRGSGSTPQHCTPPEPHTPDHPPDRARPGPPWNSRRATRPENHAQTHSHAETRSTTTTAHDHRWIQVEVRGAPRGAEPRNHGSGHPRPRGGCRRSVEGWQVAAGEVQERRRREWVPGWGPRSADRYPLPV